MIYVYKNLQFHMFSSCEALLLIERARKKAKIGDFSNKSGSRNGTCTEGPSPPKQKSTSGTDALYMVAGTGLEPVRVSPFDFKSNAYTNSAIRPLYNYTTHCKLIYRAMQRTLIPLFLL